jgi:uncharacterized protein
MKTDRLKIAVIGAGISGMSAAWLLSQRHDVTIYEAEDRAGGHSHTVDAPDGEGEVPVDMGFIVYNEANYPNLVALFDHLGVTTQHSDMSFGVSLDGGAMEYGGNDLGALFAQRRNIVSPRFWSMLSDLVRFYRSASAHPANDDSSTSLTDYLAAGRYGRAFCEYHLLPQAAAIWSSSVREIGDYPASAFIRFFQNHGLLKITDRPAWRTVKDGSRAYLKKLTAEYAHRTRLNCAVASIWREPDGVWVRDVHGQLEHFDDVVVACHADQALAVLDDATPAERELLGVFRYSKNLAVLHTDDRLMPRRKAVWSAWNYLGTRDGEGAQTLCVTYWMNKLQALPTDQQLFVTLNPMVEVDPAKVVRSIEFDHPLFDGAAMRAQSKLWSLQGERRTWFAGAYFGSGFHEDGLQAGLAVAEALGGVRRPWTVPNESGRIFVTPPAVALREAAE